MGIRPALDEPLAFETDDGHRRRLGRDEQVAGDVGAGEARLFEQRRQHARLRRGDPVLPHRFLDAPALEENTRS